MFVRAAVIRARRRAALTAGADNQAIYRYSRQVAGLSISTPICFVQPVLSSSGVVPVQGPEQAK